MVVATVMAYPNNNEKIWFFSQDMSQGDFQDGGGFSGPNLTK